MKRLLSSVLLLSTLVCSLISCSSQVDTSTPEPITFVFYNADGVEETWSDPVAKEITRKTGVTLDVDYPVNSDEKRVKLMIASGEYPDFVFAKGESQSLIEARAFIDLTELIEQYGPNIKKLYGDEFDKLKYSKEDPSIYQLSSSQVGGEVISSSGTAQLQWAVLKENQYVIPRTLYMYEKAIKTYMQKYQTINGKDTIGISLCCSDWHWYTTLSNPAGFIANGSPDNGQWIIEDSTYTANYKTSYEGQKEYFKWLNQMYDEGILDPEFATQTNEEYLEKIAEGRVLGIMDADWNYEKALASLKASNQYERTYAGLPVTMNETIKCSWLMNQGLSVGWGIGITKACKDPVRAIKFIDYLCSEEGQILLNWGLEGVNYFVDEEGKRYRTEEEIKNYNEDTGYKEKTGIEKHRYPFPSYGDHVLDSTGNPYTLATSMLLDEEYDEEQRAGLKAWNVRNLIDIFPSNDEFATQEYSPVWTDTLPKEIKNIQDRLDKISWKGLIDCIICSPEQFEEEWSKLQSDLDEAGREKAEQMLTEYIREEGKK
ncbi:MAG: extracellular solute-binding protein [bacterium]|nr:extracellular solute-binding protein [bacterium]